MLSRLANAMDHEKMRLEAENNHIHLWSIIFKYSVFIDMVFFVITILFTNYPSQFPAWQLLLTLSIPHAFVIVLVLLSPPLLTLLTVSSIIVSTESHHSI